MSKIEDSKSRIPDFKDPTKMTQEKIDERLKNMSPKERNDFAKMRDLSRIIEEKGEISAGNEKYKVAEFMESSNGYLSDRYRKRKSR